MPAPDGTIILYYVTIEDLIDNIKLCWASLWSDQAMSYRDMQGIDHASVDMAVVVQEMVPSHISGVTFTVNPVSGAENEIVTDATWGMGSAIVDGRVSPDHYVVNRDDLRVITQRIANKPVMVSTTRTDGEQLIDVPADRHQARCLTEEMLAEVTNWAIKSEVHFGTPQDLEWAFFEGKYHMLQSRPITNLGGGDEAIPERRKLVIYKAIAENFTDPLLPLTEDLTRVLMPTAVLYKGRMYSDVAPARLFLPLHMTDEEMAQLLYWEMPEGFKIRIRWLMLPFSAVLFAIFYLLAGVVQVRSRAMPNDFMESFRGLVKRVDDDPTLTPIASISKLLMAAGPFAPVGNWVLFVNITAVLRYFILMGMLNKLLARWMPGLQRDAGSLLCSGSEGVFSADMGRSIYTLSVIAKQQPDVTRILRTCRTDEVLPALQSNENARHFVAELGNFLAVHGHRALKEFEVASPRFDEDPSPVFAMIKNHLYTDADPGEMERQAVERRVELAEKIRSSLAAQPLEWIFRWRWRTIEYLADRARYFVKLRENSRFYHIMSWNSARKKVLRAEKQLLAAGKLKAKGDIFYLLFREVRALLDDKLHWNDVEVRVRERRMRHIRWSKQTVPTMINIETRKPREPADVGQLDGQGASPGIYEGIARVILDPSIDAELHPGEILIAPYTDPAWTPLFLVARAAVVGVGSYLSHAGTIAREYGMPCVVGVTDCTLRIKTGDRLMVDGTNGIVRLLAEEEAA